MVGGVTSTRYQFADMEIIGWWLCKNPTSGMQGWAPAAYVEEIEQVRAPPPPPPVAPPRPVPAATPVANGVPKPAPATRAKPMPPAPPAKRPVGAGSRKPIPPPAPARDSAVSLGTASGTDSGRGTPNSLGGGSLAGGLAEALRARQNAMAGNRDKDDDDDW